MVQTEVLVLLYDKIVSFYGNVATAQELMESELNP